MTGTDVIIVIDPFPHEEQKFHDVLGGFGAQVWAIADHQTSFPTVLIPSVKDGAEFVELAAGWTILTAAGTALSVDVDKPERTRKIGNEFHGM